MYELQRSALRGAPYLRVEGTVRAQSGTVNLLATAVAPLALTLDPPALSRAPLPPSAADPADLGERTAPRPTSPPQLAPSLPAALRRATPASHDFH